MQNIKRILKDSNPTRILDSHCEIWLGADGVKCLKTNTRGCITYHVLLPTGEWYEAV